jgi:hypothetical protein
LDFNVCGAAIHDCLPTILFRRVWHDPVRRADFQFTLIMQELRERCGACVVADVLEVVSHAEVKKEYFHELLFRRNRVGLQEFFQVLLAEILLLFLLLLGLPLLISLLNF